MKKIFYPMTLTAVLSLFFGCASTKLTQSAISPVAFIDIEGNAVIWKEADEFDTEEDKDDGEGMLGTAVNKLIYSKDPEILTSEDRMNYAEESLRFALEERGVKVIDKQTVLENKTYKYDALNLFGIVNTNTAADGYRKGLVSLPSKKARMFLKETGAKSILSAQFDFSKKIEHKRAWPLVSMKIIIQDEKGRKIFNEEFLAESTGYVQTYGAYNKYEKSDMVQLMNPLIDDVINRFVSEYFTLQDEPLSNEKSIKTETAGAPATKLGKPKSSAKAVSMEENKTSQTGSQSENSLDAEKAAEIKTIETAKNLIGMGMSPEQISKATGFSIEKVNELKIEKAAEDKTVETAKNLIKMGMPPEKISEATGLSIEKVNKLKNE